MTTQLIQFFALLLLMLVTGIFWGPWFALHRSMKVFSKEEFIKIVKTMSANLAVPMRILMPCCVLLVAVSSYLQKNSFGFYFQTISLILIVLSLIVTIAVEVPIVKQIEQWTNETVPSNIGEIQDKWLRFHVIRTFSAILSFASFVASILLL